MLQRDIKSTSITATRSSDDLQYCCKHHQSLVPLLTRMIRTATSRNKVFFYPREHFQTAAQDRSLQLTGRPCPTHSLWHAHLLPHSFQGSCFTAARGQTALEAGSASRGVRQARDSTWNHCFKDTGSSESKLKAHCSLKDAHGPLNLSI